MTVGLRQKQYRDRDLDRLARDTDAGLRELLAMIAPVELAPDVETELPLRWRGKPVYMRNFSGTSLGSGFSSTILAGVERVLCSIGWGDFGGGYTGAPPISISDSVHPLVDSDGNLVLFEQGTVFDGQPYDLTVFYTRKGGG